MGRGPTTGSVFAEYPLRSRTDLLHKPWFRPQNIIDLFGPDPQGIVEHVGVAMCRLDLRMAKELADHRHRHPARNEQRREGVRRS